MTSEKCGLCDHPDLVNEDVCCSDVWVCQVCGAELKDAPVSNYPLRSDLPRLARIAKKDCSCACLPEGIGCGPCWAAELIERSRRIDRVLARADAVRRMLRRYM